MHYVILCATFLLAGVVSTATAEEAEWLLRYQKEAKEFVLNEAVLPKISALKPPITVISAIGDARVGKSTTLNFVRHIWDNNKKGETNIEEVFVTGGTTRTVTEGIWISIYEQRDGKTIILLDVEGVNLGNDVVTDHLSMFTAMLSSGIGLFCSGNIKNHILDFLYRLPRLHSEVFKHDGGRDSRGKFGHLHAIIRGSLDPPDGQTLEEFVKDVIFSPSGEDEGNDKKRKVIAEYFDQRDVSVSSVPEIPGGKLFRNTSRTKDNHFYWKSMKSIAQSFKNFPMKTTLRNVHMDGNAMSDLLQTLAHTINENSWMEFGDTYLRTETSICWRSYEEIIAPVLRKKSAKEVNAVQHQVLTKFSGRCPLEDFVKRAQSELLEYAEKLEEEEKKRESEGWMTSALTTAGTFGLGYLARGVVALLSDAKLKHNITTATPSKYNVLGLREVAWVWNEDARRLGLSGEARGVIAQEVEQLYPWVVVTGPDGYKRVNYIALDLMVVVCKAHKVLSSLPFKSPWQSRNLAPCGGQTHEPRA